MWLTTLWTGTFKVMLLAIDKFAWKYIPFVAIPAGCLLIVGSYCNW